MRTVFALCLAALTGIAIASDARADALRDAIIADSPRLTALYRALHVAPELSFMEVETSRRLVRELEGWDSRSRRALGGRAWSR